ncbi:MAG: DUF4175 domain-containing protein [Planctomycetes bacterium]|nr:DUF4175 domain-containing protein [Planctomycetota bacterium]
MGRHRQPSADSAIRAALLRLRRRRRRVAVAAGMCAAVATACGAVVLVTLLIGYWPDQPPAAVRRAAGLAAGAAVLAAFVAGPARGLMRRETPAQTARLAEQACPALGNALINAVQLDARGEARTPWVIAAVAESAARLDAVGLAGAVSLRPLKRAAAGAAGTAALLAVLCALQGPRVARAVTAVLRPDRYVGALGTLGALDVRPGDATLYQGQTATVTAAIAPAGGRPREAHLLLDRGGGPPERLAMLADAEGSTFTLPLGAIHQTTRYAVRVGDARAPADRPWYTLAVTDPPGLERLAVRLAYPAYTGLAPQTRESIDGPLEAPTGTTATLTAHLGQPAARMILHRDGQADTAMAVAAHNRRFAAALVVDAPGTYALYAFDASGRLLLRVPQEGGFAVTPVADSPPAVAFVSPAGQIDASPGDRVPLRIRAADDYGLTAVRVHVEASTTDLLAARPPGETPRRADLAHTVDIPLTAPAGAVWRCRTSATDNRRLPGLEPQQADGAGEVLIRIRPRAAVEADRLDAQRHWADALRALLAAQVRAKLAACLARDAAGRDAPFLQAAQAVRRAQQAVGADARSLLDGEDGSLAAMVRRALASLVAGDLALADAQAAALADAADAPGRAGAAAAVIATQDRILDALQTLLAVLPSVRPDAIARPAGDGEDLPPAAAARLADLAPALRELAQAQHRMIDAAERLTKTPADAFTGDDLRLVEELRAAEDQWELFLNEAVTDFSRLFRQDFSNPTLLAELVSIHTDVTLARGALEAPAVQIATAADAMSGAAENAAELTANIEKWLPDQPDRTQWVMEDPGGHDLMEMPELPSELEDLVGDLLEDQADLFQAVQDFTAQAAASLDEGAGWSATGGPISSLNAQGVTGNVLPDSSEVAGRSGEGRQGRSRGEFVQDTFTGKGGRQTPTRLTGDPFSSAQVRDASALPPGGATGGGKIGGAAGEGLEGPVPPQVLDGLGRLAGRQAHLVNRAERLAAQAGASDYGGFRLQQAVVLMNRVRADLRQGHYRNALRRREVLLGALDESRRVASAAVRVVHDPTAAVPTHIREDLDRAGERPLPVRYRTALQSYLHKLAGRR